MVVHSLNLNTQEMQTGEQGFKLSLSQVGSSKPTWDTQDLALEKENKQT